MSRYIHTFACGEVGIQGTRVVLEGGRFTIGGSRGSRHMTERRVYQSDRLIPYVGKIIYFTDNDDMQDRIMVHEVTFEVGIPGTRRAGVNRSVTGKFICNAKRLICDESDAERSAARERICDVINTRNQDRCPGRLHRRHALVICTGSCCTSCGGPIDEDSECRCDGINARNGVKP